MQDRPTIPELLTAVTHLLDEEVVPNLSGSRQFYGRVAANVLRIVMRELEHGEEQSAAEWQRLDACCLQLRNLPKAISSETKFGNGLESCVCVFKMGTLIADHTGSRCCRI